MSRIVIAIIINLIIVLLEVNAFINQLRHDGDRYFIYYTHLSNIFAGLTSIIYIIAAVISLTDGRGSGQMSEIVRGLRLMSTTAVAVTFIVVVTVLAPSIGISKGGYKKMLLSHNAKYVHFICPLLSIISFIFFETGPKLDFAWTLIILIPTLIYGAVAVICNIKKTWDGPYNFLKVHDQSPAMSVLWGFLILGGAYLIGLLLWSLSSINIH